MRESADPLDTNRTDALPHHDAAPNGLLARLRQFWWRNFRPQRIHGQQTLDVQSERAVVVEPGAILAGFIVAPHITVSGLVYGYLVAREVVVKAGAQVWGDVYAPVVTIEEEGVVHGWCSTPDEATLIALANGQVSPPQNRPELPPGLLPAGADQESDIPTATARLILLQHLQAETGRALTSRAELEQDFDQRVAEVAGEAFAQLKTTTADLETRRQELAGAEAEIADLRNQLSGRENELTGRQAELAETRRQLATQAAAALTWQTLLNQKTGELETLQAAHQAREEELRQAGENLEALTGRMENVEGALQDSLQRAAEQEEALLHWQELAEVTQNQVKALQTDLDQHARQAAESEQVIARLRDQRQRAEETLEAVTEDLEQLRAARPEAEGVEPAETGVLEAALAEAEAQRAAQEAAYRELQEELRREQTRMAATSESVAQIQQELFGREEQVHQLQAEVEEQTALTEKWKSTVGKLSDLLYTAEKRVAAVEAQRAERTAAEREAEEALKSQVRRQKMQLAAMEQEVDYFNKELLAQGKRLSTVQAELAEKHLALEQAEALLAKQTQERENMKQAAAQRIAALEADLAKTQRQLNDLLAWAERKR